MISPHRLMRLAILLLAINLSGLTLIWWIAKHGATWGTAFWFIFFTGGIWLAHLYSETRWPR